VEFTNEKELISVSASSKYCVVHFCLQDFKRCSILNKHLQILAQRHLRTKFCIINVQNCPFLVQRLDIKTLPCLISFVEGVSVDRIIGFETLGNRDDFRTEVLEKKLKNVGVLPVNTISSSSFMKKKVEEYDDE
jgi:thioredoxin-like negative regulator of GroEL